MVFVSVEAFMVVLNVARQPSEVQASPVPKVVHLLLFKLGGSGSKRRHALHINGFETGIVRVYLSNTCTTIIY